MNHADIYIAEVGYQAGIESPTLRSRTLIF
jgi:hypothetical protein